MKCKDENGGFDGMRLAARNLCAYADRVDFFIQSADWEMASLEFHRLKLSIGIMDIQLNLQCKSPEQLHES
jgi:hypothetical protein